MELDICRDCQKGMADRIRRMPAGNAQNTSCGGVGSRRNARLQRRFAKPGKVNRGFAEMQRSPDASTLTLAGSMARKGLRCVRHGRLEVLAIEGAAVAADVGMDLHQCLYRA